jgi:hypothetical protein
MNRICPAAQNLSDPTSMPAAGRLERWKSVMLVCIEYYRPPSFLPFSELPSLLTNNPASETYFGLAFVR